MPPHRPIIHYIRFLYIENFGIDRLTEEQKSNNNETAHKSQRKRKLTHKSVNSSNGQKGTVPK